MENSTVFVLVTDKSYFYKTYVTINDLRTAGMWAGEIAIITIDFDCLDVSSKTLPGIKYACTFKRSN